MLQFLNSRRSIREYSDKKIDPALLDELLAASAQASNTGNMQTYSVVVTAGNELKQALAPAHFNQKMITGAAAVLTFCADFSRFSKWCKMRNAEAGYANFQSFTGAAVDAVIFAQTFAVAAESQGLGICYLGTTTYNAQEIISALNLPALVMPVTTITVGYPAENPPVTDRLPLRAVVHYEKYQAFGQAEINSLYAEKENSDIYRQYVAENAKETLAQVFTDVRYTKANNEFFSKKYLDALKMQGFLELIER
jgi:nitroreductase